MSAEVRAYRGKSERGIRTRTRHNNQERINGHILVRFTRITTIPAYKSQERSWCSVSNSFAENYFSLARIANFLRPHSHICVSFPLVYSPPLFPHCVERPLPSSIIYAAHFLSFSFPSNHHYYYFRVRFKFCLDSTYLHVLQCSWLTRTNRPSEHCCVDRNVLSRQWHAAPITESILHCDEPRRSRNAYSSLRLKPALVPSINSVTVLNNCDTNTYERGFLRATRRTSQSV